MKRILAVLVILLVADLAAAQPNLSYSFLRDGAGRPSFGIGLRPVVTPEMGIPPGTPFFDMSTFTLYYWSGSAWTGSTGVSLPLVGGALSGTLVLPNGTAAAPSLTWSGAVASNVGIWLSSAPGTATGIALQGGQVRISSAGGDATPGLNFIPSPTAGRIKTGSGGTIEWTSGNADSTSDTFLGREAAASIQMGGDAASAISQTFKGADSTGNGTAGGILTIRGGAGTAGDAAGGNLNLVGGNNAGAGEEGVVVIVDGGTKPTCSAANRGAFWYDQGGAGVADTFEICAKSAADAYAWRSTSVLIP